MTRNSWHVKHARCCHLVTAGWTTTAEARATCNNDQNSSIDDYIYTHVEQTERCMIHRASASSALCIITSMRRVSSEEASQCRRYASSRHSRPTLAVGVTLAAGHEQSRRCTTGAAGTDHRLVCCAKNVLMRWRSSFFTESGTRAVRRTTIIQTWCQVLKKWSNSWVKKCENVSGAFPLAAAQFK